MSRSHRLVATAALVPALALLAAGCQNKHPPQTDEHTVINGTNSQVGTILIRDATFIMLAGGGGYLPVAFYNQGSQPDALTGAQTAAAGPGILPTGRGQSAVTIPPQTAVLLNQPGQEIRIGPGDLVQVGDTLTVTLTFAKAGTINLAVPVEAPPAATTSPTVSPSPSATPSAAVGSGSPSPTSAGSPATATSPAGTSTASAVTGGAAHATPTGPAP